MVLKLVPLQTFTIYREQYRILQKDNLLDKLKIWPDVGTKYGSSKP